jgi:hypothetical protein
MAPPRPIPALQWLEHPDVTGAKFHSSRLTKPARAGRTFGFRGVDALRGLKLPSGQHQQHGGRRENGQQKNLAMVGVFFSHVLHFDISAQS